MRRPISLVGVLLIAASTGLADTTSGHVVAAFRGGQIWGITDPDTANWSDIRKPCSRGGLWVEEEEQHEYAAGVPLPRRYTVGMPGTIEAIWSMPDDEPHVAMLEANDFVPLADSCSIAQYDDGQCRIRCLKKH